jgi:tRNA/rRNA methyltransferase
VPEDVTAERLKCIRIVLARPRDSKNIGAVCRAMKNMGLTNLYIAGCESLDRDKAQVLALHAADVLEQAVLTETLEESLDGCSLVAGVTRRWGKHRKYLYLDPPQLSERLLSHQDGVAAIVFGNEVSGLSDAEMQKCHVAVTIPSSDDFPSLNLSHAVQVIAYEVYRTFRTASGRQFYTPVTGSPLDSLVDHIADSLLSLGFFRIVSPSDMKRFWRDILVRASLSGREADRMRSIFTKIAGIRRKIAQDEDST